MHKVLGQYLPLCAPIPLELQASSNSFVVGFFGFGSGKLFFYGSCYVLDENGNVKEFPILQFIIDTLKKFVMSVGESALSYILISCSRSKFSL